MTNMFWENSVAVVSAIRVGWKDEGNDRDAYYMCKSNNTPNYPRPPFSDL